MSELLVHPPMSSLMPECSRWYAAYTLPRHEKRAAQQLELRVVDCFLPLYRADRRWQHRRATVELPLFPGYLFVHMSAQERMKVLTAPGILELVGPAGRPTPIEDSEIDALRTLVSSRKVYPVPYLQPDNRVRFAVGVFEGLEGTVVRTKGMLRVVISIDTIMRSMSVEVDRSELELIRSTAKRPAQPHSGWRICVA